MDWSMTFFQIQFIVAYDLPSNIIYCNAKFYIYSMLGIFFIGIDAINFPWFIFLIL